MIRLQVNGDQRACSAGLNLEQALLELGYKPRLVVVEFNGTILPRQAWPTQPVESDVLEVVTIVGGGS